LRPKKHWTSADQIRLALQLHDNTRKLGPLGYHPLITYQLDMPHIAG